MQNVIRHLIDGNRLSDVSARSWHHHLPIIHPRWQRRFAIGWPISERAPHGQRSSDPLPASPHGQRNCSLTSDFQLARLATSLVVRMRASSWEMMRPNSSACGERNAARSSRKIWGKLFVQLGVITGELNRAWYQRSSGSLVKDVTEACTPSRAPMDGRYRGRDRRTDRRGILKRSSCCLGPSPKRRPKSTWLNCSIACGPLPRDQRCCRLLPAVASRSRSRLTPIAPSAPSSYGRAKALKARRVRRGPFPVRDRSSPTETGGRPNCRYGRVQSMGRACGYQSANPIGA